MIITCEEVTLQALFTELAVCSVCIVDIEHVLCLSEILIYEVLMYVRMYIPHEFTTIS